ncbi:MAG TPA: 2-dehydro-3-deoxygalactonokinase [Burkholderiaceae bacterium]|nr:2-dehydro-3-deoxygalactonokinase [Burkholderiaceae bacterium]
MDSGLEAGRLIGLDWGTSSLRGWLFDAGGRVLDRRSAPLGILTVRDGRFDEAFERLCAAWLAAHPAMPVIASGMIGSRQGWREAAYLETPAGLDALAGALRPLDDVAGRRFRIVPGLATRSASGAPDVLRGEETQVFGALCAGASIAARTDEVTRLFVLPGTHSKWVAARGTTVTGFRSWMTGELYAVLREHSILGRMFEEPADPEASGPMSAFDEGVDRALAAPGALGHLLFTVRSEGLLGERAAGHQPAYLSGLLIGAEIADALRVFVAGPPTIIAPTPIAGRYCRALSRAGVDARIADEKPAPAGLFAIALRAGLIE